MNRYGNFLVLYNSFILAPSLDSGKPTLAWVEQLTPSAHRSDIRQGYLYLRSSWVKEHPKF
jgi:hypothetical protein